MFENLDIFRMSSAMASHAARRHTVTAQNMANSDTPGYKAQRLASFGDAVEASMPGTGMRATRGGHLHGQRMDLGRATPEADARDPSPDGNTVSVEREMLEAVSAKREHDRALTIYRSAMKILHSTLSR